MNLTLAWLNLLGDVRQLPFLGIYVIMFFDILKTFLRFGIVFIIFIVAFGLGFHLLLINQTPFQTVGYSLLKTSVMMTGEFEYESIFHNDTDQLGFSNLTFVFFLGFLIIMYGELITFLRILYLRIYDFFLIEFSQFSFKGFKVSFFLLNGHKQLH